MQLKRISVNTPLSHCDQVREAMATHAGKIGNYTHCSFSVRGTGRSKHGVGAQAFATETVEEERIESFCKPEDLAAVVQAIKTAHPYEEPAISVQDIEIY